MGKKSERLDWQTDLEEVLAGITQAHEVRTARRENLYRLETEIEQIQNQIASGVSLKELGDYMDLLAKLREKWYSLIAEEDSWDHYRGRLQSILGGQLNLQRAVVRYGGYIVDYANGMVQVMKPESE
ncbi:hypothetical protein [Thermogutta sp.]|uniref:hypothetical protein n=1 Tax=Thermogutta sp. TaxID=1962930 RepID=UPI00321FD6BC